MFPTLTTTNLLIETISLQCDLGKSKFDFTFNLFFCFVLCSTLLSVLPLSGSRFSKCTFP